MTPVDVSTIPALSHDEAMAMQAVELDRALSLLRSLDDAGWTAQTDCPAWDVRRMYLHVLGACEAGAAMRENIHQLLSARSRQKRDAGPLEAALSAVQVDERGHLSPAQLVARLEGIAPKTVRGRRRVPALMRNGIKIGVDGPVIEKWKLGYLLDTVYLRDLWMHRVDAARAVGRLPELTTEHDGRIVADVVAEWARRHRRPFTLTLDGPAGGVFVHQPDSADAETLALDAVEFGRTLAGRVDAGGGLMATIVPF